MRVQVWADGVLQWGRERRTCGLGQAGVVSEKREGDGGTPAGTFPLRRVLYRNDRIARPETQLPVAQIQAKDGWCDDPADENYNRQVTLPYPGHCETMWRDDGLYDLVVILGHNDDPPVPGRGSAIFLHIAKPDYAPTEGCVALAREDLEALLKMSGPETYLSVYPALAP